MSHNVNTISLELNAATDLVDRDTFATVFAIHNRYAGKDPANKPKEKAMPISVLFGANTKKLAKLTIQKGSRFIVSGELDYDARDGTHGGTKEFYTIRANQLTPIAKASDREDADGNTNSDRSERRSPSRRA